jgi:hypothetical protein
MTLGELLRLHVLRTRLGGLFENGCDVVHGVELTGGNLHDAVVRGVVGETKPAPVDAVEGDECAKRQPLVPVDEGMVPGQRVQQGGRLGVQVWVGIRAESRCLRPGSRRFQQADVADGDLAAGGPLGDVQKLAVAPLACSEQAL